MTAEPSERRPTRHLGAPPAQPPQHPSEASTTGRQPPEDGGASATRPRSIDHRAIKLEVPGKSQPTPQTVLMPAPEPEPELGYEPEPQPEPQPQTQPEAEAEPQSEPGPGLPPGRTGTKPQAEPRDATLNLSAEHPAMMSPRGTGTPARTRSHDHLSAAQLRQLELERQSGGGSSVRSAGSVRASSPGGGGGGGGGVAMVGGASDWVGVAGAAGQVGARQQPEGDRTLHSWAAQHSDSIEIEPSWATQQHAAVPPSSPSSPSQMLHPPRRHDSYNATEQPESASSDLQMLGKQLGLELQESEFYEGTTLRGGDGAAATVGHGGGVGLLHGHRRSAAAVATQSQQQQSQQGAESMGRWACCCASQSVSAATMPPPPMLASDE
jgi:hypothetical protein